MNKYQTSLQCIYMLMLYVMVEVGIKINSWMGELVSLQHFAFTPVIFNSIIIL